MDEQGQPMDQNRAQGAGRRVRTLGIFLLAAAACIQTGCACLSNRGADLADILPPEFKNHPLSGPERTWRYRRETDSYVHVASGFVFPGHLGEFVRHVMTTYDPTGHDVSAGYDITAAVTVTVYVFPAPPGPSGAVGAGPPADPALDAMFHRTVQVITRRVGVGPATEEPFVLADGTSRLFGRQARFEYRQFGTGMSSLFYLVRHGDFFLKFRVTFARAADKYATDRLAELMKDFKWPPVRGAKAP